MKPVAGTALGNRYRLDRLIAVGGMGEVWVAHDLSLRRNVAVKVLREEFAGDAGFLERFRTEARNAASLSHPNIAATYDYGEQSGSSYLVMELVDGEPLSDLLERQPVLPESRLLPVLAQTARALHAAHLVGVVHRDVKPGNILLGAGGRVKITDFGVSTAPDQAPMTATGMVMGTAQYLSPEQAVGRPATARSDLYSLGVVAYEALAGKRPFTGPTAVDIAVAHVNDPVPPLPPTVSPPVAALVMRLLAKDPADRPASAGALARTLDGMVGHTPPDGVPVLDEPGDERAPAPTATGASAPPPAPSSVPVTAQPPVPHPDVAQPDVAQLDVAQSDAAQPDVAHPVVGQPVVVRPLVPTGTSVDEPAPAEAPGVPAARPGVPPIRPVASPHATPPPSYPPQRGVRDPRGAGASPAAPSAPPPPVSSGTRPLATPAPASPGQEPSRRAPSSAPPRSAPSRSAPSRSAPSRSVPPRPPRWEPVPPGPAHAHGTASRPPTATATRPPRAGGAPPRTRPDGPAPVRTSTTTGRRFGRLGRGSWPLLALVLLLVALLVAALADTVDGSGEGGATAGRPETWCDVMPDPGPSGTDGIMVCAPVSAPRHDDTTTAKDA